jgi:hypothetical protein
MMSPRGCIQVWVVALRTVAVSSMMLLLSPTGDPGSSRPISRVTRWLWKKETAP